MHKKSSSNTFLKLLARLKKHELKVTDARKAILQALFDHHGPFSVEELQQKFLKKNCDLATIYRNMLSLEKSKIVKKCEFGDGVARYELAHDEEDHHHHHLICTQCKSIEVIENCEIEEELNRVMKKHGYKGMTHHLEFFGICPKCA